MIGQTGSYLPSTHYRRSTPKTLLNLAATLGTLLIRALLTSTASSSAPPILLSALWIAWWRRSPSQRRSRCTRRGRGRSNGSVSRPSSSSAGASFPWAPPDRRGQGYPVLRSPRLACPLSTSSLSLLLRLVKFLHWLTFDFGGRIFHGNLFLFFIYGFVFLNLSLCSCCSCSRQT